RYGRPAAGASRLVLVSLPGTSSLPERSEPYSRPAYVLRPGTRRARARSLSSSKSLIGVCILARPPRRRSPNVTGFRSLPSAEKTGARLTCGATNGGSEQRHGGVVDVERQPERVESKPPRRERRALQ